MLNFGIMNENMEDENGFTLLFWTHFVVLGHVGVLYTYIILNERISSRQNFICFAIAFD